MPRAETKLTDQQSTNTWPKLDNWNKYHKSNDTLLRGNIYVCTIHLPLTDKRLRFSLYSIFYIVENGLKYDKPLSR